MAVQSNECIHPGGAKEQQSVNFVEVLRNYEKTQPDKNVYVYLEDGEESGQAITCAEHDRYARTIAARHQGAGVQNRALIVSRLEHTQQSVIAGWLPQYHDMGLISNILHLVYLGSRAILMYHIAFLQHPLYWLKAIDKYRASTSDAPKFSYELCVQKEAFYPCYGLAESSLMVCVANMIVLRKQT